MRFRLVLAVFALSTAVAAAENLGTMMRDDRQWVMPAKNYANTRYSGLAQINAGNASELRVAWTFSVGSNHGQEAARLDHGSAPAACSPEARSSRPALSYTLISARLIGTLVNCRSSPSCRGRTSPRGPSGRPC